MISTWRARVADPSEWFDVETLDRSRRYQHPLRRVRLARSLLQIATLGVFIALDLGERIPGALGAEGWIERLVVVVVSLQIVALLYDLPLDWWVDLVHDRRWGISTQTPKGFAVDQLKSLALSLVLSVLVAVPLFVILRGSELWWIWGWLLVSALSVVFGFLFPIVFAPIFNKFTPIEAGEVSARVDAIAERSGVRITGTYVLDESRRSNRDNAYVAGLGATRRVVLFDTLLQHPVEVVEQVVAHEIGHWRLRHLRCQIPLAVAATFAVFVVARLLTGALGIDPGSPASVPELLLIAQLGGLVVNLGLAYVSRVFERQADLQALELLGRPDRLIDMHRRIHVKNLADLDPSRWRRLLMSHPPVAERMELARSWQTEHADSSGSVHPRFT